ncbi:MAG: glycosyltransferase [Candidatus Marinimicrobia bacterium]|nr:glycosyltransferase [Candidatus Neomarinimicrobiota bacterium]
MKVVLVGPSHPYRGGISHYNTRLYQAMLDKGHEPLLLNFKRMYPSILFPGKTQYDESGRIFEAPSERLIDSVNPISWFRAARFIKSADPDAVIFHWWQPFFGPCYSTILNRLHGISGKRIFICHNVQPHEESFIDGILSRRVFKKVDRFIVHSEEDKVNLLDMYPNAVIMKNFHPVYDIFKSAGGVPDMTEKNGESPARILFFGYVRKYKGLIHLLEAMPEILQKMNLILTIAGEFYDEKIPYLELIDKLGISKNVKVIDRYIPNEEVSSYFENTDLVVIPYTNATQSGIVQISYNFGVPVVVTRVGGLPEVVWDGETGYIVEPGSSSAVADAVIDYFKNGKAEGFKKNIIERQHLFSWDNLIQSLESLIK